jgi:tRNA threonylcarbamoyladenosine biosynthesis protein TsaB
MRILGLDTATLQATVALVDEHGVHAEAEREVTTHSEGLLALIDQTLSAGGCGVDGLDAVACGRGPGSFTGLRIGMATAKGLCLAVGKPLLCISSLLPLAEATRAAAGDDVLVAALIDARRGELYCGLFRAGALVEPELLCRPEELTLRLADRAEPVVLAGDGALLYREQLLAALPGRATLAPDGCHVIRARHLARAAAARLAAGDVDDLATAVPLYIRSSDARLPTS